MHDSFRPPADPRFAKAICDVALGKVNAALGILVTTRLARKPLTVNPLVWQVVSLAARTIMTTMQPVHYAFLSALQASYQRKTRLSRQSAIQHRRHIANGNFYFSPSRVAFKELIYPVVAASSVGVTMTDIDGNDYIDFCMGWGAHMFGYSPPELKAALQLQLDRGWHIGVQAEAAAEVASLFCSVVGAERVFFSNTGTESVMTALRLARAVTGRDRVVMFRGAYHGHADHFLVTGDGLGPATPSYRGVPASFCSDTLVLGFGDPLALEIIEREGSTIAAILVDPLPIAEGVIATKDFLVALRGLADHTGAALVFDEVLTGLRLGTHGAQGYFGVDADLAAYGKVLGGGMPMGAVAGKARFLDAVDGGHWHYGDNSVPTTVATLASGTFCRHPLSMVAARAVLQKIVGRGPTLYEALEQQAIDVVTKLTRAVAGFDVSIERTGSVISIEPNVGPLRSVLPWLLNMHGVYAPRGDVFVSTEHSPQHATLFADAVRKSLLDLDAVTASCEPIAPSSVRLEISGL
jgi:glutamate-1-semialdehyde 2,1-aminomutase